MATAPLSSLPFTKLPKCYSVSPAPPTKAKRRRPVLSIGCCLALCPNGEHLSCTEPGPQRPSKSPGLRTVFAGGGSGGHIFPALAIADELKSASPGSRIVFVGTGTGMERDVVPSAGYEFVPVPKVRLARPFLSPQNLILPFQLLRSIAASWRILRDLDPDVVVGTGAYVSAPVCLAAALMGLKLVIQEQNCCPGITNQALAPYAHKIFLAFNACLKYFPREKCVVCGNPIKFSISRASKAEARMHFFPNAGARMAGESARVVLVLGGSTGANALNAVFSSVYRGMLSEHRNLFIIWQTGAEWYNEVESTVRNHRRLLLTPFLDAMDLAYAAADVVVSRAGAMTCTEILLTGKPSILIPSPTAAEDHQTKNAYTMADLAGSKVITEDELDSSGLEIAINGVLGDEVLMAEMSEKALRAARPNAASDIVQGILSLLNFTSTT